MIESIGLTKRYGPKTAVDGVSFTVRPGVVTGFLGPNGSGKSTTMRLLLGLDRPDAGQALINGHGYRDLPAPLCEVGALLEARAVHTGRSARNHLLAMAATHRISRRRVDHLIGLVGLDEVAGKRVGAYSLGMGQRLGIAAALLGDPEVLLLDEPVNGLDPEGILWIRNLLKSLAAEGRTVFVSSHLMSEMALTASEVIVVGRGRLITSGSVDEVIRGIGAATVLVRAAEAARLAQAIAAAGHQVTALAENTLRVTGTDSTTVGQIAAAAGVALSELTPQQATLEEAFMEITRDSVEFHGGGGARHGTGSPVRGIGSPDGGERGIGSPDGGGSGGPAASATATDGGAQ
ncbi:MAG: ATP-binding cassette domain-containing protein [Actinomycetia bacterium]|nr:ATP-binding cassette domain-containing protein [Actinomycetes bacterium]